MLTTNRARLRERRGIALILILGMLGLLAFIGVTFATISGQARVGARNYAQSVMRPQPAELMEYALSQLIGDTDDVRSAIRGHSMARDAYGNDAYNNGYLPQAALFSSTTPLPADSTAKTPSGLSLAGTFQCVTNMPSAAVGSVAYYGYDFTRWLVRFNSQLDRPVDGSRFERRALAQTYEIVYDDPTGTLNGGAGNFRTFFLVPLSSNPQDKIGERGATVESWFRSPDVVRNPSAQAVEVVGALLIGESAQGYNSTGVPRGITFTLDGRFLRAFNGPGMGPLAQYANMRYNAGMLLGAPNLLNGNVNIGPGDPNVVGMDEDYDACDLENWFLAIQSADGKSIVPSFHRPGILTAADWTSPSASSRSKILRPRTVDGHDPLSFRNLTPNATTGRIEFDVDNDADGVTDSVWVDLGYPPVRDARGFWYKPLFAFLVIGLNGRIPLNTAGNLQMRNDAGAPLNMHTSHVGYSPSEIDPSFGLQNAGIGGQLDNANIPVNVTQLRNILAGARPYVDASYSDQNYVTMEDGSLYFLPNNVLDASDVLDGSKIGRLPPRAVPGRWGEGDFIASFLDGAMPLGSFVNLVRAGVSVTGSGSPSTQFADGRDDNLTTLDYWPVAAALADDPPRGGEFMGKSPLADPKNQLVSRSRPEKPWGTNWPADYADASGISSVFSERARRFVTPIDIAGDGRVEIRGASGTTGNDEFGRVAYRKYFRPPGFPIATAINVPVPVPASAAATMKVTQGGAASIYDVTNNPYAGFESQRNPKIHIKVSEADQHDVSWQEALLYAATPTAVDPDGVAGPTTGGKPFTEDGKPTPTYTATFNSQYVGNPGLNEADETDVYSPKPSDDIFGFEDLEWLYRAHDQDGSSLYSRLSELAPLSFRDASDAIRRRRLYSIDVWESNAFAWANDNPGGYGTASGLYGAKGWFDATDPDNPVDKNSRFQWPFTLNTTTNLPQVVEGLGATANASMLSFSQQPPAQRANYLNLETNSPFQSSSPSLVHRDRKINLNYPFPVSNESKEPTRRKWIFESYQFLKNALPPLSVDTPEELAMLSQFLVNIVDFRDPDATMTQFTNPDVYIRPGDPTRGLAPGLVSATDVTLNKAGVVDQPLVQFGMEYNPIAINEVLAYSFKTQPKQAVGTPDKAIGVGRFFIELINTLTDANSTNPANNASWLNLGGFAPSAGYAGGCWDLIFTDDSPSSRPDPFTGQIPPGALSGDLGCYAPTPLSGLALSAPPVARSLPASGNPGAIPAASLLTIGNTIPDAVGTPTSVESSPYTPTQTIQGAFNPMMQGAGTPAPPTTAQITATQWQGIFPKTAQGAVATSASYKRIPLPAAAKQNSYKWVCLRRPANPFVAVSADNPMVVVDAMRFAYVEGSAPIDGKKDNSTPTPYDVPSADEANAGKSYNRIYSLQRFQPYRGGHIVAEAGTSANSDPKDGSSALKPLDVTRYGYSEQIFQSKKTTTTQGIYLSSDKAYAATAFINHSLGVNVDATQIDTRWNRFVFNDREFMSPAELMLVPGCPPGLFTKLFAEFEPKSGNNKSTIFVQSTTLPPEVVTPPATPTIVPGGLSFSNGESTSYPYLQDRLFYSSASPTREGNAGGAGWDPVQGPSAGGWYKMFEFFEVPSPAIGATGPAAQGVNFDWFRQDVRPGQINLNLIIDEEVFLGLMGNAGDRTTGLPNAVPPNLNGVTIDDATQPRIVTQLIGTGGNAGRPEYSYPMTNVGFFGASKNLKSAFVDFLSLRHGATNLALSGSFSMLYFGSLPLTSAGKTTERAAEMPFRSLTYPDINYTIMRPAFPTANQTAFTHAMTDHGVTKADPGIKNKDLVYRYNTRPYLPPAIPPRRLFALPDKTATSNASIGPGDAKSLGYNTQANVTLRSQKYSLTPVDGTNNPTAALLDSAQHPYYRSEWLQKMMNLSTVRSHQYAVWVTVGFFEVTTLGDPAMASINPDAAYDVLGREVGTPGGRTQRHRGFFVVDRLKLNGFDPRSPGQYKDAVLYRRIIQ